MRSLQPRYDGVHKSNKSRKDLVAKGLSPESVTYIMKTRRRIFAALQHYVQTNKPEDKTRIGDLLLFTLGPLSSLANSFSEDVMVTNLIGAARIDQLMAELILVAFS